MVHKEEKKGEVPGLELGVWPFIALYRGILHNEEIFPELYAFRPEMFLNPDGSINPNILDPSTMSFGSGRR